MKQHKFYPAFLMQIVVILMVIFAVSGCKKETVKVDGPPSIKSVSYLTDRQNVLPSVNYGEWILIKGQNLKTTFKVDFNNILAADSLYYADDSSITVKIPPTLPDPANNPITVTTKYGSVTYNFKILQPKPIFNFFSPVGGDAGETITLSGDYFDGLEGVKFGNMTATIVSKTKTEIKVKVPAGFTFGNITITTPSGSVTSPKVFGFQYLLFGDAAASGWWSGPWGGSTASSTEQVRRGTHSLKFTASGGWGGAKYGKNYPDLDMTGYTGFKVSLYGGPGTDKKKVKVIMNGVGGKGYEVLLKEGAWVDFQIPFSNLGNPAAINTVTLQEFSGNKSDFYIDDMGFY
ncbi:MAG: IPT/TIG domain-containing protein [Ginsengibacter sp.]